jgi:flagellar biosynthetic protein FliO
MNRLFFFLILFLTPLLAEAPSEEPRLPQELINEIKKAEEKEPNRFAEQFSKMLFYLGILIGLLFVILWFVKKFQVEQSLKLNKTSVIQVLETRPLSQKSILYLVAIEETTYLLSESQGGVTLIQKIDEKINT